MPRIVCPQCNKEASVPEAFLGRQVRCNQCNTQFAALSSAAVTKSAPGGGSPPGVARVVARPVGDSSTAAPWRSALWIAVAAAAFLLPVVGAAAFVRLHSGGQRSGSGVSGEGTVGEIYGGIEIGSGGVKPIVIELFPGKEFGYRFESKKAPGKKEIKLVTGLKENGEFDEKALAETIKSVGEFLGEMTKNYPGLNDRIFIVCSSGLFKEIADQKAVVEKNKNLLADKIRQATGRELDFLDVQREVRLMINGVIEPDFIKTSVLIDIGTGSTRGGYFDGLNGSYVSFEAPGAVPLMANIKANAAGRAFVAAAADLADTKFREPLVDQMKGKDGLVNRKRVYLNGGAAWVLSKLQHPSERKTFVQLSAQDIDDFYALVHRFPDKFPVVAPPDGMDPKVLEEFQNELGKMKKIFPPEQLIASTEILKAVSQEFRLQGKEIYFNRVSGDVAWLLAYIADKGISGK